MWSDEMDNRIRGAAENDIPAYDDKTWQGMESLLDKHLPQKRKRRGGYIFFLLLGLLLVIPGIFMAIKYSSHTKTLAKQEIAAAPGASTSTIPVTTTTDNNNTTTTTAQQDRRIEKDASAENPVTTTTTTATGINANNDQPASSASSQTNTTTTIARGPVTNAGTSPRTNNNNRSGQAPAVKNKTSVRTSSTITTSADVTNAGIGKNKKPATTEPITETTSSSIVASSDNKQPNDKNTATTSIVPPVTTTTNSSPLTAKAATEKPIAAAEKIDSAEKKKQPAGKKGNKFMLTFSLGPDLTSVGTSRTGKVEGQYGVGIGYAVTNHLTIRTGLYAGRKVYTADSNSYNYGYNSGGGYKLYKIDANCLVYEVPVTMAYNFKGTEKHNWFVSTGLSSYFMKDEKYVYNFKTSSGQAISYDHQYKNENQHIFSILNLSGGYQYNFSKRFSLLTEPYIKLPVGGIGEGKVKLNSAGVLFTAVIRPFAR